MRVVRDVSRVASTVEAETTGASERTSIRAALGTDCLCATLATDRSAARGFVLVQY